MALEICFRNQVVDLADGPLYVKVGAGMVINRLTGKDIAVQSLLDAMTREHYTAKPGEVDNDAAWEAKHDGWWTRDGLTPQAPPPQTPVATGATAGTPGAFTPAGAQPADLAALTALGIGTGAAWADGAYVELGDASRAWWDGAKWVAGAAPIDPADVVVRTPTTLPSQTAEIQYATSESALNAAGTVSVSVTLDGGSPVTFTVAVAQGDQGHQIAVAVAATPQWVMNGITAAVAGAKVTLDVGAAHQITALTSSVA